MAINGHCWLYIIQEGVKTQQRTDFILDQEKASEKLTNPLEFWTQANIINLNQAQSFNQAIFRKERWLKRKKLLHKFSNSIKTFYTSQLNSVSRFKTKTLGKPLQPTVKQVENLILPLLALENLFRLARGERVAKGKKKNIAYLRQFNFKLSLQNSAKMVISKQHIFLEYSDQIKDEETIPSNSPLNNSLLKWQGKKIYQQEDSIFGKLRYESMLNFLKTSSKVEKQTEKIPEDTMNFITEEDSVENKCQQQVWKDYLGFELKEYDEGGDGDFMLEQGNGCSFGSFRGSINFNNENNY